VAFVVQHGESEMNDIGRIGGDSDLSAHGQEVFLPFGYRW